MVNDIRKFIDLVKNYKPIIKENYNFTGKTIMCVDIQSEYESGITFDIGTWVEFINDSYRSNRIVFLYNGEETLGMISEYDYKYWLMEHGISEDVIDGAVFYDKGYAFFRYCIDNSIDDDSIVDLVKFMITNDINDSRDFDEDMWNKFIDETNVGNNEVKELLEYAGDMINIPDLMDFLKNYSNIVLMGGGINECLKEVEIALNALDKNYETVNQFIY